MPNFVPKYANMKVINIVLKGTVSSLSKSVVEQEEHPFQKQPKKAAPV